MRERCLELVEDVAIDARLLAADLKPHLFAERPGHVADQPRKPADPVGQRPHATHDHLVVESVGEVLVAAGETLEILDVAGQGREAGVGPLADSREHGRDRGGHGHVGRLEFLVEGGERVAEVDVGRPELKERVDERPQLPRLHQGLTREAHESRQALGRDAYDTIDLVGGPRGGRSRPSRLQGRLRDG